MSGHTQTFGLNSWNLWQNFTLSWQVLSPDLGMVLGVSFPTFITELLISSWWQGINWFKKIIDGMPKIGNFSIYITRSPDFCDSLFSSQRFFRRTVNLVNAKCWTQFGTIINGQLRKFKRIKYWSNEQSTELW